MARLRAASACVIALAGWLQLAGGRPGVSARFTVVRPGRADALTLLW